MASSQSKNKGKDSSNQSIANNGQPASTYSYSGIECSAIKEGLAHILVTKDAPLRVTDSKVQKQKGEKAIQSVFYNPIQQFNRDLSVLAIRAFGESYITDVKAKRLKKRGTKRQRANVTDDESVKRKRLNGVQNDANKDGANKDLVPAETLKEENSETKEQTKFDQVENEDDATCEFEKEALKISRNDGNVDEQPQFKVLDALSATGLRALRYAKELPFVTSVTANDLSKKASDSIKLNVKHNGVEEIVHPTAENAIIHMYSVMAKEAAGASDPKYQVIDLDPYGTVAPFLDAALQAVSKDGLLCITSTDTAVFASNGYPEKAYSQYGGLTAKGYHCHEAGLRLILQTIASTAARYGLAIEPLLSLSIDFYVRIFVRVRKSAAAVKFLASKTMLVYSCDAGCGAWQTQFLAKSTPIKAKNGELWYKHTAAQAPSASAHCEHCGFRTHIAGPMYGGPIHNPAFIQKILSYLPDLDSATYGTLDRLEGMLQTAHEEIPLDNHKYVQNSERNGCAQDTELIPCLDPTVIDHHPFYFNPSLLAKVLHTNSPPDAAIKGALRHAGYHATRSHAKRSSIKTNAPWPFVWRVMCEWICQKEPVRGGVLREGTAGWKIAASYLRKPREEVDKTSEPLDETPIEKGQIDINKESEKTPLSDVKNDQNVLPRIVFDEELGKKELSRKKLRRYQLNPWANWGPMTKARG